MAEAASISSPVVGLTLNYRDAKRTLRCVRSLLADGVEHVLVWDNSEDAGQSAGELQVLLADEPRVHIEVGEYNLGFSAGVNHGLAFIKENYPHSRVLLINNDAVLLAGATEAMTTVLQQSPNATIVYPTIDHAGRCIGTVFYQRHFGLITLKRMPGSIPHASGCCQLLDPTRLSGPWFDEEFFMYGEDVELGHRLAPQHMLHVPEVWVRHEGSASSGMGSAFYETRMVAAHWILVPKLARNRFELGALYLGRVVALSLRAVVRACRYRSLVPLKSLWDGWCLAYLR